MLIHTMYSRITTNHDKIYTTMRAESGKDGKPRYVIIGARQREREELASYDSREEMYHAFDSLWDAIRHGAQWFDFREV